jgi:hypothetical protein
MSFYGLIILAMVVTACGESQSQLEERCTPVLQNILNIQEVRDIIRQDFHLMTIDYKAGRMSFESWEKEKNTWLSRENALLLDVDSLYEHSYKTGCLY